MPGPRKVSAAGTHYRFERFRQHFWQLRAVRLVRNLQDTESFDVAQHVTIGSWRQPSCLAFCSIPYIFGPTSGSEKIPPGFLRRLGLRGAAWELARSGLIELARWDPLVRRTLRRAARILVVGPATYTEFEARYPHKTIAWTRAYRKGDIAMKWESTYGTSGSAGQFLISWMGRLIPRKGLDILLRALSDPILSDCVVEVIGDGPYRAKYTRLAAKLGIRDRIRFLGHMDQTRAFSILCKSDLFVFTSLQDMMGQALSEAMQLGLPCVVFDRSGPAWLAGSDGAYKVKISTYEETCRNLARTICEIKENDLLRRDLAGRARNRIESLTNAEWRDSEIDALFETVRQENI